MIKRLDQATINKIAAGEVIVRPENVVKELLENCLDAQSDLIQIQVKDGGLKLIQITDNGTGILKEDLELVCERFTTSKLVELKDLENIQTFGFRGEALASITYCSHVSIVSKSKDSQVAYKGSYSDGKLLKPPQPIAGNQGTQIVIEDLFYNIPTRKKALRNFTEEYNRILDVVQRYAVEFQGVSFNCKKFGASRSDVVTQRSATRLDVIRSIFGDTIAKELLEFNYSSQKYQISCTGLVSNPNYSIKKKEFILFINKRLVDCSALRNALVAVYQKYLPKQSHAFLYISLTIRPENVDVNVHPTKKQVVFLNQDSIVSEMAYSLDDFLANSSQSRVFYVQSTMPSDQKPVVTPYTPVTQKTILNNFPKATPSHMLVRTDARSRKITSFFNSTPTGPCLKKPRKFFDPNEVKNSINDSIEPNTTTDEKIDTEIVSPTACHSMMDFSFNNVAEDSANFIKTDESEEITISQNMLHSERVKSTSNGYQNQYQRIKDIPIPSSSLQPPQPIEQPSDFDVPHREWNDVQLTSILELRNELKKHHSNVVTEQMQNHTFVGLFNDHLAIIQHNTHLLVVNFQEISGDLMYQRVLFGFSNLGVIKTDPASIKDLVMIALEEMIDWDDNQNQPKADVAQQVQDLLIEKKSMLQEYFSIVLTVDGDLIGIPNLLDGCLPEFAKLPDFLLYLGASIDFTREQECFDGICIALAKLYAFDTSLDGEQSWKDKVENYLFPALRSVIGLSEWIDRGLIIQVANLSDLYKIFERC